MTNKYVQNESNLPVLFKKKRITRLKLRQQGILHLFAAPGTLLLIIFVIFPIVGVYMAFAAYRPAYDTGFFTTLFRSQFVGFWYFSEIFKRPDFLQILFNTVFIAIVKIVLQTVFGILLALLLNEVMQPFLKKLYQTLYFLPFFLSWALLGSMVIQIFSLDGLINKIFGSNISFLASNTYFRPILIITDLWKNVGYQAIYFLAAITCIDATHYEAARIDGANKFKQCVHITIPGIMPIIILVSVLNLGNIMNAGFEQVLILYNPLVYKTGDIIDTMAYRVGLLVTSTDQFSFGTAIGLFKALISCLLFVGSYTFAAKKLKYSIL